MADRVPVDGEHPDGAAIALLLRDIADHIERGHDLREGTWLPADRFEFGRKKQAAWDAGMRLAQERAAFALRCIAWMNEHGFDFAAAARTEGNPT